MYFQKVILQISNNVATGLKHNLFRYLFLFLQLCLGNFSVCLLCCPSHDSNVCPHVLLSFLHVMQSSCQVFHLCSELLGCQDSKQTNLHIHCIKLCKQGSKLVDKEFQVVSLEEQSHNIAAPMSPKFSLDLVDTLILEVQYVHSIIDISLTIWSESTLSSLLS